MDYFKKKTIKRAILFEPVGIYSGSFWGLGTGDWGLGTGV
jgi:hypothetical protein